jgi:hypothetical protein
VPRVANDELDDLLMDRFNLDRPHVLAALKALPVQRPGAAALTADQAHLLNSAGFTDEPRAYASMAATSITQMGKLYSTSYTAAEVANGLGVNDSRVRQRRLAHTLWAIDDGGTWVYPAVQFEVADDGRGTTTLKQVRGLDQVLPHLLTRDLHPAAIAGFLLAPQVELPIAGQPQSVRDWLLHGEPVQPVLDLIDVARLAVT